MSERWRRWGRGAGMALMVAASLVISGPHPGSAAPCPAGAGTTVVVDFAAFGAGVVVGCAPTAATGFEALAETGFDVVRVQQSPQFLCRIDGLPTADDEDCVDVPSASAYWSYWTGEAGGDWRLSQVGAGSTIQGQFEGWAFAAGTTAPPGFAIPAATTTTSTTSTTTSTSTTSTTTTTTAIATAPTTSSTTSTTSTTTASTTSTTLPATSAPTSTSSSTIAATTTTPPSTIPDLALAADDSAGGGGMGQFVAGVAVVGTVAASALYVFRRRGEG